MNIKKCLISTTLLLMAMSANASEYGCTVVLCLAGGGGGACNPPLDRLFDDLRKGRGFPGCDASDGNDPNSNFIQQNFTYYDVCPKGTTALGSEQYAAYNTNPYFNFGYGQSYVTGIGTGDGLSPGWRGRYYEDLPVKVCVGNKTGSTSVYKGGGRYAVYIDVGIYDRVEILQPQGSPRVIDLYLEGSFNKRIRY